MTKAADILRNAKKPIIVLGSQATLPPVPATELKKHLEALGVPCFLAGMCRGRSSLLAATPCCCQLTLPHIVLRPDWSLPHSYFSLPSRCKGLLGRKSPLHIRQHRSDALKEADVIILAGTLPRRRSEVALLIIALLVRKRTTQHCTRPSSPLLSLPHHHL